MLEKEVKKIINQKIVDNQEGAITAEILNEILNKINQNTKHSEDLIVAGRAISLGSMPYMWYYSSQYLCFNFKGEDKDDYNIYVDGGLREINNDVCGNVYTIPDTGCQSIYRLDHVEGNNIYIVSKPFNGNANTTMPDVVIRNYRIINERDTKIEQIGGGSINNIYYGDFATITKYARRVIRNYPKSGKLIVWKFTYARDAHQYKGTSFTRNIARQRWLSDRGVMYTCRYENT